MHSELVNNESRSNQRKRALEQLSFIQNNRSNTYFIHYACTSFESSYIPRIISISIRRLVDGQTHTFSIAQVMDTLKISLEDYEEKQDLIEKTILVDYNRFLKKVSTANFIHWNMRDAQYGFNALENKSKSYKIKPTIINDKFKFDFARILTLAYGRNPVNPLKLDTFLI